MTTTNALTPEELSSLVTQIGDLLLQRAAPARMVQIIIEDLITAAHEQPIAEEYVSIVLKQCHNCNTFLFCMTTHQDHV